MSRVASSPACSDSVSAQAAAPALDVDGLRRVLRAQLGDREMPRLMLSLIAAAALDQAPVMPCYADTPAGAVRRAVASGSFADFGDAGKTVDAMISAMDAEQPALRLALGSSTFNKVGEALRQRLEILQSQQDVALSVME